MLGRLAIGMRRRLLAAAVLVSAGAASAAALSPGATSCALVQFAPLERLADGSLYERGGSPRHHGAAVAAHHAAIERITRTFGAPVADPYIIYLDHPARFWPFVFSPYASTHFAGPRICVVAGPDGRNVDVLAHELVHAEVAARVGFWRRMTQIPVWFDEGAAMQVDDRAEFNSMAGETLSSTAFVEPLKSFGAFFAVDPDTLTRHFTLAKSHVAAWFERVGRGSFYRRLRAIRTGQSFDEVWRE